VNAVFGNFFHISSIKDAAANSEVAKFQHNYEQPSQAAKLLLCSRALVINAFFVPADLLD
jgi:hypothetical protein